MGYDEWVATVIVLGISDDETRAKVLATTPTATHRETVARSRARGGEGPTWSGRPQRDVKMAINNKENEAFAERLPCLLGSER